MALLLRMLGEGDTSAPLWSFTLKCLKRHLDPLKFIKSLPFCANSPGFCFSPSCRRVAKQPQQSRRIYSQVHVSVRLQRSWGLPRGWPITHWRSWRLYTSPHGRWLWGKGPSRSSPLHVAFCPALSRCGRRPSGDPFTIKKKPPLWRLCVISGLVNRDSAGMHIEQRYRHCGADEHPGRNLIFLSLFSAVAPPTWHASPECLQNVEWTGRRSNCQEKREKCRNCWPVKLLIYITFWLLTTLK